MPEREPVVGDTVHYYRRVTPHAGPAIASEGELQTHAALIIALRRDITTMIDLKVTDRDGETYIKRSVNRAANGASLDGCWDWRRP